MDRVEQVEKAKAYLRNLVERAKDLHEKLGDYGAELTLEERKLLNMARLPAIQEMYEIGLTRYLLAQEGAFEEMFREVEGL